MIVALIEILISTLMSQFESQALFSSDEKGRPESRIVFKELRILLISIKLLLSYRGFWDPHSV